MSDDQQGICSLPETLETEQVVEILEESQFLDLAASMETGGVTPELGPAAGALEEERMVEREREYIAGQKRKRVEDRVLEEAAGLFGLSLPTAIVPPSPRQVIASPLPQPPKSPISTPSLLTTDTMTTTLCLQTSYSPSSSSPPLPAVNIQLTSEELQALFGILQQRGSAHNPHPQTPTESACSSQTYLQPIAPKSLVTAVVVPSSSSSFLTLSSRDVIEAQTVVAAKASVKGKKRHCTCKNSQCLKLYCDCFSHEEYCSVDCSCKNCHNNPAFSKTRELTLKMYKGRDPTAFQSHEARQLRGCRCRKTLCLKKYCECFHSGIRCSSLCRCINCKNTDTSSPSPLPQGTSSHPPLSQTTSSPSPLSQSTSSPSPLPQITSSHPPITTAHSHAVTQIPEDTPSIASDPECCRLLSDTVSDTLTYNNPSLSQNES